MSIAPEELARRVLSLPPGPLREEAARLFEELLPAMRGADPRVEAARASLIGFTEYTYPEVKLGPYVVNWHHKLIGDTLDAWVRGDIRRLMVMMPPRSGKSELCSRRLPAYIFGKNPNALIIACSHAMDLASSMNRDVQRIMDTDSYRNVFPKTRLGGSNVRSVYGTPLRNASIFEIAGHAGYYRAGGVGTSITGKGYDFGIIDDPHKDAESALSKVQRDSVWEWYTSTFLTRQEKDARIMVVQTRWHEDDLCGRLLVDAPDDWHVLRLPALCEEKDKHASDPRSEGEALWPGKHDLAHYESIRKTQGFWFSAMYQQRPSPPGGGMFKSSWWKHWDVLPKTERIIQSWDCAFKGEATSDYVVGQVWGKSGGQFYLLDQVRGRWDFPQTVKMVLTLRERWPNGSEILIEDKANGPAVIAQLRRQVSGLVAVNPEGGKESRAASVTYLAEAGNVFLPPKDRYPWVVDYIEEHASFPKGANDDMVDATSQALARLAKRGGNLESMLHYEGSRSRELASFMGGA